MSFYHEARTISSGLAIACGIIAAASCFFMNRRSRMHLGEQNVLIILGLGMCGAVFQQVYSIVDQEFQLVVNAKAVDIVPLRKLGQYFDVLMPFQYITTLLDVFQQNAQLIIPLYKCANPQITQRYWLKFHIVLSAYFLTESIGELLLHYFQEDHFREVLHIITLALIITFSVYQVLEAKLFQKVAGLIMDSTICKYQIIYLLLCGVSEVISDGLHIVFRIVRFINRDKLLKSELNFYNDAILSYFCIFKAVNMLILLQKMNYRYNETQNLLNEEPEADIVYG